MSEPGFDYDWVVIGSGFGGSVAALRLAEKGYSVGVLECGRRYEDDDFAESTWQMRSRRRTRRRSGSAARGRARGRLSVFGSTRRVPAERMWGVSFSVLIGAMGLVLLGIALIAGWGLPLLAVGIVILAAPFVLSAMSREEGEPGSEAPSEGSGLGGKPSWMRKRWWQ